MRVKLKTRRLLAAAATCVALLAATPMAAFAEPKEFDIGTGKLQLLDNEGGTCPGHIVTGSTTDTDNKILVESGVHDITIRDVTIDFRDKSGDHSPFAIGENATVNLSLEGNNEFYAHKDIFITDGSLPAIWVRPGAKLTIGGSGALEAVGADTRANPVDGAAGIGGKYNEDFGDITINSGSIVAYGSGGGAGIGGGYLLGSGSQTGGITINGGYVQAFGGSYLTASGAGIGAGENGDYDGTITINGGVVHAVSGDPSKYSIGGGGSSILDLRNGEFTTGENGNAVIVAPWGIGDKSHAADWDCILLETTPGEDEGDQSIEYSEGQDGKPTVAFTSGTPQVYGDVKADYNITVNSPASLRVATELDIDGDEGPAEANAPSTLTMLSGTKLTNNNGATDPGIAGIALEPGSTLVLIDGTSQCEGDGVMIATSAEGTGFTRGKVQLPLSDDMVSVEPDSYVYDGTEKTPEVSVSFPKWGFTQTFTQAADYTVSYENNINVGAAKAIATSASGNLLNTVDGTNSTGTATFEITVADLDVNSVAQRYVQVGEDQLLSKLPGAPTFGANVPEDAMNGTFAWFSDEGCTVPLTDTFVQDKSADEKVTVYWKYEQTGNPNLLSSKTGKTILVMTNEEPPAVQVDNIADDKNLNAKYGDVAYSPEIKISLDGGLNWIDPLSEVSYFIKEQQPKEKGDVVSVDKNGAISFVGAGSATVVAEIEGYTDPDASGSDTGKSYGPAYVSIYVTVDPAEITVEESTVAAVDRPYNGTPNVVVNAQLSPVGIVESDLTDGEISLSAKGIAAQPEVDSNIFVDVVYELTGDKADDYKLKNSPDTTVNITKAQAGDDTLQGKNGELIISNGAASTYVFDLSKLYPDSKPVDGGTLYPGSIEFKYPQIKITNNNYFDENDITVDNSNQTLRLSVNDVASNEVGDLGTITLDMDSSNFTGMKGTIFVKRENLAVHTITASADEGGSISPSGNVEVVTGHDQTFTITANSGYEIADVVVDGTSQGAISTYTFSNVTDNHAIDATFKKADGGGTVTPPTPNKVKLTYVENGGDPVADVTVTRGTKVNLATPVRTGYTFTGWYADEGLIDLVGMGGDELTLTKNTTLYAGWEITQSPDAFIDDHINYVLGRETAVGSRIIAPMANVTRAEVATMVYRLLTDDLRDEYRTDECDFADVSSDAWYAEPVATLAAMGAVRGYPEDGLFHPNDQITRAELTAIVTRLDERYKEGEDYGSLPFKDVPAGHWASQVISYAVNVGWLSGDTNADSTELRSFRPDDSITRAETMAVLNRMLGRLPETEDDLLPGRVEWPDNQDKDAWYWIVIEEATNNHNHDLKADGVHERWTRLLENVAR